MNWMMEEEDGYGKLKEKAQQKEWSLWTFGSAIS